MDRIDKIRILTAIHEGSIMPEDLRDQRPYPIQEISPGIYEYKGKQYTTEQIEGLYENEKKRHEGRAQILGTGNSMPFLMFTFILPEAQPDRLPADTSQAPQPTEIQCSAIPGSIQEETTFTEAQITNQPAPGEPVKPVIIKDPKQKDKRFNLLGELIEEQEKDRERSDKMNQFKNINKGL